MISATAVQYGFIRAPFITCPFFGYCILQKEITFDT